MIKRTLPVVSSAKNTSYEELQSIGLPVLQAHIDENDEKSKSIFNSVAESLQNDHVFVILEVPVGVTHNTPTPYVLLLNPSDYALYSIFQGDFDEANIASFARLSSTPLIGLFGPDTFARYLEVSILTHLPKKEMKV